MLTPGLILRQVCSLIEEGTPEAMRKAKKLSEWACRDGGALTSDAFAAQQVPIAPLTWEVFGVLQGNATQSEELPMKFPRPVQLVAIRPSVVPLHPELPAPPFVLPSLDDLLLSVNIDQERQLTAQQQPGTTSAAGSQFVTAASLALGLPRLLAQDIRSSTPQLTFQFRWRQGANIFVDCSVSVAVFARYRDEVRAFNTTPDGDS